MRYGVFYRDIPISITRHGFAALGGEFSNFLDLKDWIDAKLFGLGYGASIVESILPASETQKDMPDLGKGRGVL